MSYISIVADSTAAWHAPVLISLLVASIILWMLWLIKAFITGGPLAHTPQIPDRPYLSELALVLISLILLTTVFAWLLKDTLGSAVMELALAGALANLLTCSIILALIAWNRPQRLSALGLTAKGWARQLAWGSLAGLAVWPLATILLAPISLHLVQFFSRWIWRLSYTAQEHSLLQQMSKYPNAFQSILVIVLALLVAPITEEIIFRGLLQGALARTLQSRWLAICLAAAVFALFHLGPRQDVAMGQVPLAHVEKIPPLFLLGLALGYAYEKSRSLYRPIALHLAFNALSIIFFWLNLS